MLSKYGLSSSCRKKSVIVTLIFLMASMLIPSAEAQIPPSPPHAFYGAVSIDGNPVPDGSTVLADIAGVVSISTTTSGGKYGYDPTFKVPADDPNTEKKDGGADDDLIKFYVEGFEAGSATFKSGEATKLELVVMDGVSPTVTINPVETPTTLFTQTITGTFEETFINTIVATSLAGSVTATIDAEAGTYSLADVPLMEGSNTITVTATDLAGNIGTSETMVVLDTTPPTISAVKISDITTGGTRITWTTDEPSTRQVEYGKTAAYGSMTPLGNALITSHSSTLTGLEASTTYHFRAISADEAGNTARSIDQTFTTAAAPTPPAPGPGPGPAPANKPPVADAGADQIAPVNGTVYFTGVGSSDPDGHIESYMWDLGDGARAEGMDMAHVYTSPGSYAITLTVTDDDGATDADSCVVTVRSLPAPTETEIFEAIPVNSTGYVVDASVEVDTTVTVNTTAPVTVTIIKYESNPHPEDPMPDVGVPKYADVFVSDPDAVDWPIYVEMAYTEDEVEGLEESSLGIYYWMDGAWKRCSDTGVDTERNVVWAYMTAEEASGSPILMGGMPTIPVPPLPPFLSNLTITPAEIELGDNVTISFDIMNTDSQSFTYIVTMKIGELTLLVDVELEAYESKTVSRTITPDTVGDFNVTVDGLTGNFTVKAPPIPAVFEASNLKITPEDAKIREEIEISFTVTNIGEETGNYKFSLFIEEPYAAGSVEMVGILGAGESETVTYKLTPQNFGYYKIEVDGLTEIFSLKAPILTPAEFEASNLEVTPQEVEPGATVMVSATITNIGEKGGIHIVELKQDGEVVDSESVTFDGGASVTVSFTTSSEGEGRHSIEIDGLSGSFTVKPIVPIWMRPGTIAGIIIVIIAAAILYAYWKGILPSLSPEIDEKIE